MRTSKAWLPCGRERLLPRMVRIVRGVVRPVVAAARRDQSLPALPDEVRYAYDAVEDGGPLAGIAAGFDVLADSCDAAFVVACDYPLLRPSFITRLIELLDDHPGVVPQHGEHLHPLAAVYRLDTRTILTDLLAQGDLWAQHFAQRAGARIVPAAEFADGDPKLDSLRNVNDPDTYDRVIREIDD